MIAKTLLTLVLLATLTVAHALAGSVNVDSKGVALEGNDPVAFFTDKKPVKGSSAMQATAEGAIYYFSSQANLDAFKAAPKKYLPAYGGYCAYGVAGGSKVKVEIDTWQIVDGKLYLNYDQDVKSKFNKDVPGYIAKANANWPKVATSKSLFSW